MELVQLLVPRPRIYINSSDGTGQAKKQQSHKYYEPARLVILSIDQQVNSNPPQISGQTN